MLRYGDRILSRASSCRQRPACAPATDALHLMLAAVCSQLAKANLGGAAPACCSRLTSLHIQRTLPSTPLQSVFNRIASLLQTCFDRSKALI
jgi:hypothetical protein